MLSSAPKRMVLSELGLTHAQRMYLNFDEQPETTVETRVGPILQFAYRIAPSVDARKLDRAVEKLARRHDTLRLSFERTDGGWRCLVWDRRRHGIEIHECASLSEARFDELFERVLTRPMDFSRDELFQIVLFRGMSGGDVMLTRAHHILVDGHSMLILAEELLMNLIGIPQFARPVSHVTYLLEHETPSVARRKEVDAYWTNLLLPALPSPGAGKLGSGAPIPMRNYSGEHFVTLARKFDRQAYEDLPRRLGGNKLSSFTLAFSAFAQSFLDMSELPGVYLITNVDRLSHSLKHYAGNAAQLMPVRCESSGGEDFQAFARRIDEQLKRSVEFLPTDAGLPLQRFDLAVAEGGGRLCQIHCGEIFQSQRAKSSLFGKGMETPVGVAQKAGPLTITQLDAGKQRFSPYGLRFWIFRDASHVHFDISFHANLFPRAQMVKLFDRLLEKLGLVAV